MGCYNIIYADPPWKYRSGLIKGAARLHYPVMPLEDICNLPVGNLAAENCALFLWATCPKLLESFEVIKAWGFEYKGVAFVWVKETPTQNKLWTGMGWWTRSGAELCLLATKGNPKRFSKSVHQVIFSPVREHSKKPDETRTRIVELMGDLPRIELFARQKPEGWDIWGNELENDIEL